VVAPAALPVVFANASRQTLNRTVPEDSAASKLSWVIDVPSGSSGEDSLRRAVDADSWQDSAGISYSEAFVDPD